MCYQIGCVNNGQEVLIMDKSDSLDIPCLLNCKNLLNSIFEAKSRITAITEEVTNSNPSEVVSEGLFVLSVASFESLLMDTLRYFLKCFPQKLSHKEYTINKEDSIFSQGDLIDLQIDKELMNISYNSIENVLKYFYKTLSLENMTTANEFTDKLKEIKESRNLLLHNNLRVNNQYIEKAGPLRRSKNINEKLEIDISYLKSTLKLLWEFCDKTEKSINSKYSTYTQVAAIKRLWQFLFKSPVMRFEDFWSFDTIRDKITSYKGSEHEGVLSNSELMFLGVWRSHFHWSQTGLNNFSMYSLDSKHQKKMLYFLSVLKEFRLE